MVSFFCRAMIIRKLKLERNIFLIFEREFWHPLN